MNRSTEALIWALNARGLTLPAWKVLVFLAKRVGRQGFDVWPSHKTLAEDCELSISTVRRSVQELEGGGWLKIVARRRETGDQTSNLYRLQVRMKITTPRDVIEIGPDEADAEGGGYVQPEHTPPVQREHTPCSDRTDPLFTDEQRRIQLEPIPVEDSPPTPDGVATPTKDLFGDDLDQQPEPETLGDRVLRLWHALKADEPRIADTEFLTPSLEKKIAARTAEVVRGRSKAGTPTTPEAVWDELMAAVRRSTFLCGRAPPGKGRTSSFKLTMEYVLRPPEFSKILNGAYDDDERYRDRAGFDASSGREYGAAEQAVRGALDRLGSSRQFRTGRGNPGGTDGRGPGGAAPGTRALPGRAGAGGER